MAILMHSKEWIPGFLRDDSEYSKSGRERMDEMDGAVIRGRKLLKHVRKMKMGVPHSREQLQVIVAAREIGEFDICMDTLNEMERHTHEIMEIGEDMRIAIRSIKMARKKGMEEPEYADRLRFAKTLVDSGNFHDARKNIDLTLKALSVNRRMRLEYSLDLQEEY